MSFLSPTTALKKARKVFGTTIAEEDEEEHSLDYSTSTGRNSSSKIEEPSTQEKENVAVQPSLMKRSPLRQQLAQKAQAAIDRASISVNQSLNAARKAKDKSLQTKARQVSQIRQEWHEDKVESFAIVEESHQARLEALSLERQLSSKASQMKAKRYFFERQNKLQQIDQESKFQSEVYREHQKALKEEEERRRRASVYARSKLRANHRRGEEELARRQQMEDLSVLEERYEASVALRNTQAANAANRRQSFAFRNGDARRIRQLHQQMESDKLVRQHESFELQWAGEKDAEAYQRELARLRRESLAGRNQAAKQARDQVAAAENLAQIQEHESYELKWSGERDADEYRRREAENQRNDLRQRNNEGHRQRVAANQQKSEQQQEEHESYLLKWAGEKDAEEYQRQMAEERRQSLEGRNAERVRHASVMEELRSIAKEQETESYVLEWAAHRDVQAYLAEEARKRRESLQQRGKQVLVNRQVAEEQRTQALNQQHETEVLRSEDHKNVEEYRKECAQAEREYLQDRGEAIQEWRQGTKDQEDQEQQDRMETEMLKAEDQRNVNAYRKQCADRDRLSLQYRRKESRKQRLEEANRLDAERATEGKNFELETQASRDVEDYIKDCKNRRRMSLALRAKEAKNHKAWKERHTQENQAQRSREVRHRLMDQRYVEIARQRERARVALDKLKHSAGCTFNPFSGILR